MAEATEDAPSLFYHFCLTIGAFGVKSKFYLPSPRS